MRATAGQEKIDGVHSEAVYEIVLMRDSDEMHRRLAEDQSVDSKSKVLGTILMSVSLSNNGKSLKFKHCDINRTYVQEQGRNSVTSDLSVCRTQCRTSKDECGTM